MKYLINRINLSFINYKEILIYTFGFYILFQPDLSFILPFLKSSIILFIISIYFLWHFRNRMINYFHYNRSFLYIICLCLINLYTIIPTIINEVNFINNFTSITFILNIICIIGLFFIVDNHYSSIQKKFEFLINIGLIQGIICLLMLFFPFLKNIANILYISNVPNYETSPVYGIVLYRIYGIARDYTFSLSMTMALLASIALLSFFIFNKKKYIFMSFIIIIGSILNGRTGFLIYILVTILIMFFSLSRKDFFKYMGILTVIFMFIIIFLYYFVDEQWFLWLLSAFKEVILTIIGSDTLTTFTALSSFIVFPKNLALIFGYGTRIFGSLGNELIGQSSDIGYINEIWRGGLFYIAVFYFFLVKLLREVYLNAKDTFNQKMALSLTVLFSIYLLIANYKGEALSGGSILLTFIFYSLLFSKNKLRGLYDGKK